MTSATNASTPILVAPSLLAANWLQLADEVTKVCEAGADWLHLDVMDGSFVPEISFGARFVESVARLARIPLDVHLMIESPELHIDRFIEVGATRITFHLEASRHPHRLAQRLKERGIDVGIALNPGTPIAAVEAMAPEIDLLLIMTVNPGWGGQKFIPTSVHRIEQAKTLLQRCGSAAIIQVDGGIDAQTAPLCRTAGASCFVAGTSIFNNTGGYAEAVRAIRGH